MRIRVTAAFLLGIAIGFLCLGAVLLSTGAIKVPAPLQTLVPSWKKPVEEPRAPLDLDQMTADAKKLPTPSVEPPPPFLTGPTGETAPAAQTAPTGQAPPTGQIAPTGQTPTPQTGDADRLALPPNAPHLAMPLAGIDPQHLSDTFADKRDGRKHEALDIPAPKGTPVKAVAEGNVVKLFTSKQGGITVYQFDNTQTFCFYYAHLDHYAPSLKEGTLLRKGDVLGYVGSTGDASASAPHLHFSVLRLNPDKKWWQGTAIDPLPLLR